MSKVKLKTNMVLSLVFNLRNAMSKILISKSVKNINKRIKNTLDVNVIKSSVIEEIVCLYNPDRCFFRVYDNERKILFSCDNEYLKNKKIGTISYYSYPRKANEYYIKEYCDNGFFLIEDTELFIFENIDSKFSHIKQFITVLKDQNLKSFYGFPIFVNSKFIGFIELQYTQSKKILTAEDIETLKALAKFTGVKLKDAEYFELMKYTSIKEKTLRVVSDEISMINKEEDLFKYFLSKLIKLIDVDIALYIERPANKDALPTIKHEGFKAKNHQTMIDVELPVECLNTYTYLLETYFPVVINKTANFYSDDIGRQEFYHKFNLESIMSTPLVKDYYPYFAIGAVVLACHSPRVWLKNEIDLVRSLDDLIMRKLSQINTYKEIESLRVSFIESMSHDMTIPLVAEVRAIDFLINQPEDTPIENIKPFLEEIKVSIEKQHDTLIDYIEIYKYESKIRKLALSEVDLSLLINKTISELQDLIKEHSIQIELNIISNELLTADEDELYKVILNFVRNAIIYSFNGAKVEIKLKKYSNNIELCVKDNGPGVLPSIRDKLFDRVEMIKRVQRQIGKGFTLYKSKLIIAAHGGKIWYETSEKGSTFCFSIPLE